MVWVDAEKSGSLAPYPRHKPPLLFFIKFSRCGRVPQFCTFGFKLSTSQAAARQFESPILAIGGGIFGHFCQNGILSHLRKRDNGLFMGKLRFFARLARPLHIEY